MNAEDVMRECIHSPLKFAKLFWPDVTFYKEQRQAIESVLLNNETYVPAGNMLGKDFVAAFIVLFFFMTRSPCRVVTTSAKDDHLRVLWGEIGNYIQTSAIPLDAVQGGPLLLRHHDIRKWKRWVGLACPISYITGLVASKDSIAAMQGHHVANKGDGIPRTLFVSDESSSVRDEYMTMASTWANRSLVIGNTWPCENFFKRGVTGGDLADPDNPGRYYRRVIRIKAEDSPNVKYALVQKSKGLKPTGEMLLPGVKSWQEYQRNRATWDSIQQCVSLDATFYEGKELRLFPPEWINLAERRALLLRGRVRKALAIGIDPAEGGDRTCMTVVDEYGIIEQVSRQTPNTADVPNEAIAFMLRYQIRPDRVVFDRGGGGKQAADQMRERGYRGVRTVAFGESIVVEPKRGMRMFDERVDIKEEHYAYKNRRAQMYGEVSLLLDPTLPSATGVGFAIPAEYAALRHQLSVFPKTYDEEGRLKLPPKNKKDADSKVITLVEMIGHSPDEADSFVLAVHGMLHKGSKNIAGAIT